MAASTHQDVQVRTLDGLTLTGTLVVPDRLKYGAVLVHGGGVTREEGGFFTRLADGLADVGVSTLRYDLRGHGASDGRPQESSLASHLNDIDVICDYLRGRLGVSNVHLLGASFGGGLVAYYSAKRPNGLDRLTLLNPQLNYQDRYIDQKSHWSDSYLNADKAQELTENGFLRHSPTVQHSRPFLNEVFWIRPNLVINEIATPTLLVHGTKDTFVPVEVSREAVKHLRVVNRLIEIEGAQHGFAVHDDPQYADPQSQEWQAYVIRAVADWFSDVG